MLNIKYQKSIVISLSLLIVVIIGVIPSVIAGRPGGGSGRCAVFPSQYWKDGHVSTDSLSSFKTKDGNSIYWNKLDAITWFPRPSCGAKKGNCVQMNIKYSGDFVLYVIIRYYNGKPDSYLFTGPENQYVGVMAPIPDYYSVDYIDFDCLYGNGDLWIDYLCACYVNVDLGYDDPINLAKINDIPDRPTIPSL